MSAEKIDAKTLSEMFLSGAANLNRNKELINELNVFPVPDGDTGTNMTMTMLSATKEVRALGRSFGMKELCRAVSMGSLRGARGNSGVILSQLLRGFTKAIEEHEELSKTLLSSACAKAVETAYKAVMKPKEGTILTVAKAASLKAAELSQDNSLSMKDFFEQIIAHSQYVLDQTPELLPVLKEAGVVDSGGRGLLEVFRGCYMAYCGEAATFEGEGDASQSARSRSRTGAAAETISTDEIKFGYCTEFIIERESPMSEGALDEFKAFLNSIGDSIVCVAMDNIIKIHVHTDHPGTVFEEGLKHGQLSSMKIDNMRKEHRERLFKLENGSYYEIEDAEKPKASEQARQLNSSQSEQPENSSQMPNSLREQTDSDERQTHEDIEQTEDGTEDIKEYGFVAVCSGSGLSDIFRQLGADEIIEGGQTMNPSTEDILDALKCVNAKNIFILPNNKNIILAASQAAQVHDGSNVYVVPTKTVPQGITALINLIPEHDAGDNLRAMTEAAAFVKTGQVTYAIRDSELDGKRIRVGDIMGIGDKSILSVGGNIEDVTLELIEQMLDKTSELVSIYYGEQIAEDEASALEVKISKRWPNLEVELQDGGQPIYYYIVSVE